jgi:hypothetical protein
MTRKNRGVIPTAADLASHPEVRAIRELVLQKGGGNNINAPHEWIENPEPRWYWSQWMDPLLTHGILMAPSTHRVVEERMPAKHYNEHECHKNATTLFLRKQVNAFATGFALHDDGIWYHHSWGIRSRCCEEVIVETIGDEFESYFGAVYYGEIGKQRAEGLYKAVTNTPWQG